MSGASCELPFLAGVVEGFYGRPWTLDQRRVLFRRMAEWGLNTYMYGPKDDLHHRADWRSCYPKDGLAVLQQVVDDCRLAGIRFVYALGPGLDVVYSADSDRQSLRDRVRQLQGIGVNDFALLFDDIPDAMDPADRDAFESFASAQAAVTNEMVAELRVTAPESVFLFCPTPYCSRMDREGLGGDGYLETLGKTLDPSVHVFWTGPEIISGEITPDHIAALSERLQRRPLIWDNYHANDYDLRRLYTGPIDGRPSNPKEILSGVMINPNCEFEANFIPAYTLACYVKEGESYVPDESFEAGLALWLETFEGVGEEWTLVELRLFSSLYYAPFSLGPLAVEMLEELRPLFREDPADWGNAEERFAYWRQLVQSISVKLTELKNRELFYTFNRQWWEIREEFDLFARFLEHKKSCGSAVPLPRSPEHLVGTYRGGAIRQLQAFLTMGDDGSFTAS